MTLTETIQMLDDLSSYDLDPMYGTSPTQAQKIAVLNWAQRVVAKRAKLYDPSIAIALVAGQATYELRSLAADGRRVLKPSTVVVNGIPLRDASGEGYGLWSFGELERFHPQWRTAAASTPTKAVYVGDKLVLHAPPSSAVVTAGNNYVSGTWLPKDLAPADLANQLGMPVELHESVALCAAAKWASPTVTEPTQIARIQAYTNDWMAIVDDHALDSENSLSHWGSVMGDGEDYLYI